MCLGKASGYREPKKRMSLLKQRTNFDRIKDMSVDKFAEFLNAIAECCNNKDCRHCLLKIVGCNCNVKEIKQWLESEAEG